MPISRRLGMPKPKESVVFVEGARLPWLGVLMVLSSMAMIGGGVIALMLQVDRIYPDQTQWAGGLAALVTGFVLTFYVFARWADL